jgi:hypothetical protein
MLAEHQPSGHLLLLNRVTRGDKKKVSPTSNWTTRELRESRTGEKIMRTLKPKFGKGKERKETGH